MAAFSRGFAGGEAFDNTPFEPVVCLDGEFEGLHVADRTAAEVFAADRDGDRPRESVDGPAGPSGGFDVVGERRTGSPVAMTPATPPARDGG
jgi:hypothetical protein